MKTDFPESPADRLLDELLREQSRGPDELFLQRIEAAVDARSLSAVARRSATDSHRWFAIAAGIALVAGLALWYISVAPISGTSKSASATEKTTAPTTAKQEGPVTVGLAPPHPVATPNRPMTDPNMAANFNLPQPNPFGSFSKLPPLPDDNSRGALAGSNTGRLLEKFPGPAGDGRPDFADLVKETTGTPSPMIIPKGVPKKSIIKGHYGKQMEKITPPAPEPPATKPSPDP